MTARKARNPHGKAGGRCLCGAVHIEIDVPAFWAWHDHSRTTQRAQGCAYATYVGCWKSKLRVVKGAKSIASFEESRTRGIRSFCSICGTPLFYERGGRGKMIDIPRALFNARTGREPRYHRHLNESPDWAYRQEPLIPLKGYPGVLVEKTRKRRSSVFPDLSEF